MQIPEEKLPVPPQSVAINTIAKREKDATVTVSESDHKMNVQKSIPSVKEIMCTQESLWKDNNSTMKDWLDFMRR